MALFKWVPDGIYDHAFNQVRYVMRNGNPKIAIAKMWLDQGGPDHLDAALKQQWGAFPDVPPKPTK